MSEHTSPEHISIARVYDEPSPDAAAESAAGPAAGPGAGSPARVLVDRLWPRGVRKDAARLDDWAKDVAPSTELRHWYGHDPDKFAEFRRRYLAELEAPEPAAALARLRALAARRPVRLLTATKDLAISNAAVLAELLAPESLPGGGLLTGWRAPQRVKEDSAPP